MHEQVRLEWSGFHVGFVPLGRNFDRLGDIKGIVACCFSRTEGSLLYFLDAQRIACAVRLRVLWRYIISAPLQYTLLRMARDAMVKVAFK